MSIKLEIEKGIPIPEKRSGRPQGSTNKYNYPFADMEVGDSFLVPEISLSKVTGALSQATRSTGRRFSVRVLEEGIRVWRVK